MGINIFSHYYMPELHVRLVKSALQKNKYAIFKILHKYPFRPRKGFRKIEALPQKYLIETIIDYAQQSIELSNLILKLWFENEDILRERVRSELSILGYEINELNFDNSGIVWNELNERDLLTIPKEDGGTTYFTPRGKYIDGFDPTDVTLMSIMFGWFDGSCYEVRDTNIDAIKIQKDLITDDFHKSFAKDDEVILNEILSEKDMTTEKGDNKMTDIEYKITENYESLEKEFIQYRSEKNAFIETLKKISNELDKDLFHDEYDINNSLYKDLNIKYNKLIDISKSIKKELVNYVNYINNNYNLNIELSEYKENNADVDILKKDISALQSTLSPILITGQTKLIDLFEKIDQLDKEEYTNKLEEISFDIKANKIEKFENTLSKIEELTQNVLTIIQENELPYVTNSFLKVKSEKSFKKIFKFVVDNAEYEDLFAFIYASCKDVDVVSYINKISNDHIKSIISVIEQLSLKYGNDFIISVIEDVDLINPIISNEDGKKYIILLSIYLHLINQRELSKTYLWDIKKSLNEYPGINHLVEHILYEEENIFTKYDKTVTRNKSTELNDIFIKEGGRYKKLTSISHKILKDILNDNIFPDLEKLKNNIACVNNKDELLKYEKILGNDNFAIELYEESAKEHDIKSHFEEYIKTNSIKEIEEIRAELNSFIKLKQEEIKSIHLPFINDIKEEIETIKTSYPALNQISDKILYLLDTGGTSVTYNKLDLYPLINKIVLNSEFYAFYFTNICCVLMENEIENSDLLTAILKDANTTRDVNEVLDLLKKSFNYTSSEALITAYNIKNMELLPDDDTNFIKMSKIEEYLLEKGNDINQQYFNYKDTKRYAIALKVISEDYERQIEREKLTSQEISNILNGIKKSALNLKNYFFDNKDDYLTETYILINEGLNLCEKISDMRIESKIESARKIIKEIEYLKINKDTPENLKILIDEYEDSDTDIIAKESYLQLSINDIKEYISQDKYDLLGINKKIWREISDSRKDDLDILLNSWINLRNTTTIFEDLQKQGKVTEISDLLIEMCKSLARICSLYLTNDDKKIGFEPFDEWTYYRQTPFVFTTKIKNPKCESLNQTIRIFILTEQMIGSKAYINRIKDHILDKNYHLNSFSVIFLIGDREKFNNINTNSTTRDLPVLDELVLKKILFATETKKLPKWEFTNLLVLTKNISDIQPFKSEGSVNNEVNIFVGRESIIREMTSVPKDFAIYGGRQIGKSSLLNEIKHQLYLKGFKTVISAFQGYTDSLSVARAILLELISEFNLNINSNITSLDEFKILLKQIYLSDKNQPVAILLDEVDSLIIKENNLNEHKLIEIFRDISHETEHKWIFIFAGFKEMYLQITGKGTTYEGRRNPWANFVDTSAKQLSSIENPESLVNEGLKNILGLEYDQEVSKQIVNYSSSHPAFLQHFCQCLVDHIKNQINHNNRRIYLEDVDAVFNKKDDFIKFVRRTLDMNLSDFQRLLIFLAADGNVTEFDFEFFNKRLKDWVETFIGKDIIIDNNQIKLELELLIITGVIKKSSSGKYKFTHEYYLNILKRIEQIDKDVIENLLISIYK